MPMRAEPGIQERTPPGRLAEPMKAPVPPPTPRAQAARVVVGLAAAMVLGTGPAIAWDVTAQAPRAAEHRRSESFSPSPWKTAGKHVWAAAGGIARVYLPRALEQPVAPENPSATPPPSPPAVPPRPSATVAPAVLAPIIIE